MLNSYIIWFGLFAAFVIHLFIHVFMFISFKRYVPGVITSIFFIPLCCIIIYKVNNLLNYNITILSFSILIGILLLLGLIYLLHKAIKRFNSCIEKYSNN